MNILLAGATGCIGANFVRYLLGQIQYNVRNVDKLAYAGSVVSIEDLSDNPQYPVSECQFTDWGQYRLQRIGTES